MLDALIFDLDGTLVDTNGHHVRAFVRAFEEHGFPIPPDRIALQIGKGGDRLVEALTGPEAAHRSGEEIVARHGEEMRRILREEGARPLPGARALLRAARERGLAVAIATAAEQEQVDAIQEATGLELSSLADAVVTSSDVERTKPAPDTLGAALRKLGLEPERCGFVGDTPFDAAAARRAGLSAVGVRTEAYSDDALLRAGMRRLFAHPQALLDHLDAALDVLAPGPHVLTRATAERLMQHAIDLAAENLSRGEVPIGAVVATYDGDLLGASANDACARGPVAHAEIAALLDAGTLPSRRDLVLVTTLEPCTMCLGAALECCIDTVVYALKAPGNGGTERVETPPARTFPRLVGRVRRDESRDLMVRFADAHPDDAFAGALVRATEWGQPD
jgi:HAD superfamily hydrolase (TIGR01509 family)